MKAHGIGGRCSIWVQCSYQMSGGSHPLRRADDFLFFFFCSCSTRHAAGSFTQSSNTFPQKFKFISSVVVSSREPKVNNAMSRSTLRIRCMVVSCQLSRLRLLPTAQTRKACEAGDRETTDARLTQFLKACDCMLMLHKS